MKYVIMVDSFDIYLMWTLPSSAHSNNYTTRENPETCQVFWAF